MGKHRTKKKTVFGIGHTSEVPDTISGGVLKGSGVDLVHYAGLPPIQVPSSGFKHCLTCRDKQSVHRTGQRGNCFQDNVRFPAKTTEKNRRQQPGWPGLSVQTPLSNCITVLFSFHFSCSSGPLDPPPDQELQTEKLGFGTSLGAMRHNY